MAHNGVYEQNGTNGNVGFTKGYRRSKRQCIPYRRIVPSSAIHGANSDHSQSERRLRDSTETFLLRNSLLAGEAAFSQGGSSELWDRSALQYRANPRLLPSAKIFGR